MRPALKVSLVAASLACLAAVTVALAAARRPTVAPMARPVMRGPGAPLPVTGTKGLEIRLSDATPRAEGPETAKPAADVRALSDAEAEALLARLPPISTSPDDERASALPARSLPPPRAGATRLEPWPPQATADAPPAVAPGALEVVRHAPEGDVPLASRVALTFSQPMVAIASHADAEATIPAAIAPKVPGAWRWAGSQLLIFEGPDAFRLPMATRYVVTVPAGVTSATGGRLAAEHRFTFATPPPRVERWEPVGGPHELDPLVVLVFDQRIDPREMRSHVTVAAGGAAVETRLVDVQEAATEDGRRIRAIAGGEALLDRVLALRAAKPLPYDATVTVTVEKGAPSAEGPLTTTREQSVTFQTHGPLKVVDHRCGWEDGTTCRPESPWLVRFSNPLDAERFDPSMVTVEPEVEDLQVQAAGDTLWISGAFPARSELTVTVSGRLRDVFGQDLGKDARVTFRTGPATPRLEGPAGPFVVLDPGAEPALRVASAGLRTLKVDLFRVDPEKDWTAYHAALQSRWERPDRRVAPPGTKVTSVTVPVDGAEDALSETLVDLSPALTKGLGHVVVVVSPGEAREELRDQQLVAWAQSTRLGLSAFVDPERMLAWATELADGRPAPGVSLSLGPGLSSTATSGADGLASLELPGAAQAVTDAPGGPPTPAGARRPGDERILRGNRWLLARRGDDVAFLPENAYGWWEGTSWVRRPGEPWTAWHVFDDRGLYRPGETARVKGLVRRIEAGRLGDVALLDDPGPLSWTLRDSVGNEVASGTAPVSALGGFDVSLALPAGMNLGSAGVELRLPRDLGSTVHPLRVEEFRRPEYEVSVSSGEGPFLVGEGTDVTARATYFAGGALSDAPVHWNVTATASHYQPPGWDAFVFGEFLPWWRPWGGGGLTRMSSHEGRTDGDGEHALRLDFLSCLPPRATSVTCEATIQDVNRQAWSDSKEILVHPSEAWLGLRARAPFVERGEAYDVEVIVTDRDGAVLSGREVTLRAARLQGRVTNGAWTEEEVDVVEERVDSGAEPKRVSLKLDSAGSWRITGTVRDDAGRPNETVLLAWVSGMETVESKRLQQQQVELIPDAKEYRPGDVAKVLVRAPFVPAEALVTLRRAGIVSERRLTLTESGTVVEIPIEEAWIPGVTMQVDLAGKEGTGPRAIPAFATGSVPLAVTRRVRELSVAVTAQDATLEPGGTTRLDLVVTDASGRPAAGEATVIVADEAVLALTGYRLADPLLAFYPERGTDVSDHHLRSNLELGSRPTAVTGSVGGAAGEARREQSFDLAANPVGAPPPAAPMPTMQAKSMRDAAQSGPSGPAIALRKDLSALALFEPSVTIDAHGRASVDVKLPDSLTRWRVMAVAVSGPKLFGKGESVVTARKPLMVRPSLPRFLNFGDRAELPVVVQNQTGGPLDVKVALRVSNARMTEAKGYALRVPADDRVEVRFPAETVLAGTARAQAVAVSGRLSDAAELSLPVWTPATTEAFATYGTLDRGAIAQPVAPPSGVLPGFGGLSLTTSSTALFELGDATLALWSYPFDCSEQVASRLLGVLAVRDALDAFAKLPPKAEIEAAVARDVDTLVRRQDGNGDVGLWRHPASERARWPWVSVHASHALLLAEAKGYRVPADALERARLLLRDIDDRIPKDYPDSCRRAIVAQALHVRQSFGDPDPRRAKRLLDEVTLEQHGLETLGFLLPTLWNGGSTRADAEAILAHLRNRAAEEAGTITFAQSYGDADWLVMHSSRRTDGVLLRALVDVDPQSDMLPKLVRGLLEHRVRGAWSTTQENAFILLAMDRYFAVHEASAPDFEATAWLGTRALAVQDWRGRSTDRRLVEVPMADVLAGGAQDVVLAKEGTGRLYYRLGMTYAPSSLKLDPSQHGFVVERAYEGVDDRADVTRDADGTWRVKAGALVRSRVTMVATARRTHVALTDPLPAGVESLNPALATTASVADDGGVRPLEGVAPESMPQRWWWWGPWFEHQNLRDERAEAFTSYLEGGAWEYAWVGRATTPGRFVVPPAKAEEMYHPETFGRSASDVVIVE